MLFWNHLRMILWVFLCCWKCSSSRLWFRAVSLSERTVHLCYHLMCTKLDNLLVCRMSGIKYYFALTKIVWAKGVFVRVYVFVSERREGLLSCNLISTIYVKIHSDTTYATFLRVNHLLICCSNSFSYGNFLVATWLPLLKNKFSLQTPRRRQRKIIQDTSEEERVCNAILLYFVYGSTIKVLNFSCIMHKLVSRYIDLNIYFLSKMY